MNAPKQLVMAALTLAVFGGASAGAATGPKNADAIDCGSACTNSAEKADSDAAGTGDGRIGPGDAVKRPAPDAKTRSGEQNTNDTKASQSRDGVQPPTPGRKSETGK